MDHSTRLRLTQGLNNIYSNGEKLAVKPTVGPWSLCHQVRECKFIKQALSDRTVSAHEVEVHYIHVACFRGNYIRLVCELAVWITNFDFVGFAIRRDRVGRSCEHLNVRYMSSERLVL